MATKKRVSRSRPSSDLGQLVFDIHAFNIDPYSREIYLHPYYDNVSEEEEGEIEFRMATTFIKNLNLLNQLGDSNILIHQHTVGGTWNDGIAIYNSFIFSKSTTTMLAYAHSRSMSSITIQACDNRVLLPDTEFLIHYGWVSASDRSRATYEYIDAAKKCDDRMLDIYTSRCKNGKFFQDRKDTDKDVKKYIKRKITEQHSDWSMSAEEAVFYGFVDGVFGSKGFESIEVIRNTERKRVII